MKTVRALFLVLAIAMIGAIAAQAKCAAPIVQNTPDQCDQYGAFGVQSTVTFDSNCDGTYDTEVVVYCNGKFEINRFGGDRRIVPLPVLGGMVWSVGNFTYQETTDPDTMPFPWQLPIVTSAGEFCRIEYNGGPDPVYHDVTTNCQ
jgi:hypothetical protein